MTAQQIWWKQGYLQPNLSLLHYHRGLKNTAIAEEANRSQGFIGAFYSESYRIFIFQPMNVDSIFCVHSECIFWVYICIIISANAWIPSKLSSFLYSLVWRCDAVGRWWTFYKVYIMFMFMDLKLSLIWHWSFMFSILDCSLTRPWPPNLTHTLPNPQTCCSFTALLHLLSALK